MKARSVISVIALTIGLAFMQTSAQAYPYTTIPVVSKPQAKIGIPKPVHKPVRACIINKKLVLGSNCK